MTSRTANGKHTKRFIVLKKAYWEDKFVRSYSIPEYFETKELAQAAVNDIRTQYPEVEYKVRQK